MKVSLRLMNLLLIWGETLCKLIEHLPSSREENSWKDLLSPIQDAGVRIAHLQELGCDYKQKYQK